MTDNTTRGKEAGEQDGEKEGERDSPQYTCRN